MAKTNPAVDRVRSVALLPVTCLNSMVLLLHTHLETIFLLISQLFLVALLEVHLVLEMVGEADHGCPMAILEVGLHVAAIRAVLRPGF